MMYEVIRERETEREREITYFLMYSPSDGKELCDLLFSAPALILQILVH